MVSELLNKEATIPHF